MIYCLLLFFLMAVYNSMKHKMMHNNFQDMGHRDVTDATWRYRDCGSRLIVSRIIGIVDSTWTAVVLDSSYWLRRRSRLHHLRFSPQGGSGMRQMQHNRTNAWVRLGIMIVIAAGLVLSTSQAAFAAGNVTVAIVGSNLRITGDSSDNQIEIESDGSVPEVKIMSLNGTTINGTTVTKVFDMSGLAAVIIAMKPGEDYIYFQADDDLFWNIFMQNGGDTFAVGGIGCNVNRIHLHMENGNDDVYLACSSDSDLIIDGGRGSDDLGVGYLDGDIDIVNFESVSPYYYY